MTAPWQPVREPLRTTLIRNITIAVVVGFVVSYFGRGFGQWPVLTLLFLWPSFGGHWVDLFFLNVMRPRIAPARAVQVAVRLAVWFVGGTGLALGMALTAMLLAAFDPARWPNLWLGGCAFIAIELVAQLALQLRGKPNFYNGRG